MSLQLTKQLQRSLKKLKLRDTGDVAKRLDIANRLISMTNSLLGGIEDFALGISQEFDWTEPDYRSLKKITKDTLDSLENFANLADDAADNADRLQDEVEYLHQELKKLQKLGLRQSEINFVLPLKQSRKTRKKRR